MELSKQVTSLEISKRLKELGVKQKSLFIWVDEGFGKMPFVSDRHHGYGGGLSAFTVAELGEMLPLGYSSWQDEKDFWYCCNTIDWSKEDVSIKTAETEANARGEMIIYLIENGIFTLKDSLISF